MFEVEKFKMPDGVSITDDMQKGLDALASWMGKNFESFSKNLATNDAVAKQAMAELEKQGISKESIEKLTSALKDQGIALTNMQANEGYGSKLNTLKGAFDSQFDKMVEAIKGKKQDFVIKAIDEHDGDLIQTTSNSITGQNGAVLQEQIGIDPTLHLKRRDRAFIRDIVSLTKVAKVPETYTFWEEGTEDGAIAIVKENELKPQVHLSLVKNQVDAKKAAGYIVVTEEMIKWRSRAWAAINRLFQDKVMREYDEILSTEVLKNASAYVSTPLDGTIDKPTDFTALIAASLQLESLNFVPDVLVINPADKWRLALTETSNGMFVMPYIQEGGQFGLLGLKVITTNKIKSGEFIIGESNTWFIEEEAPQIRTGLVNDDLIHNRMTIVGEIFFLSYVPSNNKGSFVKGSFSDIKEALKKS